jgi:ABC-type transport system involved in cytochrome c biogenesis permease subunit
MNSAMRKVSDAEQVAAALDEMVRLVPPPAEDHASLWHTPQELAPNLAPPAPDGNPRTELGPRVAGISQAQAQSVLLPWASLRAAWLERDAARVQQNLDRLAAALPKLAAPGVYPAEPQRQAEARYYAMGKFTYGWTVYFVAALFSVVALVSGWKTPRYAALALLAVAMAWHAYGVALRWHILGRIPVANVFEAVMAASWAGIALAVLLELVYRMRIFLVAASVTGFFSLIMAQFVIPGGGTITTIQGILDDVMLRIHTVLIVFSYALIFLAAVIALFYLFGYYFVKWPTQSAEAGLITGFAGAALFAISYFAFTRAGLGDAASGYAKGAHVPLAFGGAAIACGAWLALLAARRTSAAALVSASALLLATGATAVGSHGFVRLLAILMLSGGFGWALLTLLGTVLRSRLGEESLALAPAGAGSAPVRAVLSRPIMAGGAPGDETQGDKLPTWLHHFDWCHLILLNLVFVMLFVGTILGAVWADYSWGRPWGWDPKEVFALNTWIVYAILIHVRFLVTERGLWTAWLSIGGCLMMAFNWIFVNYFIVGLHSYA